MDDHDALQELLGAYVLGAVGDDESIEVEAHLQICAECAVEAKILRAVVWQLGRRPPKPPTRRR